MSAFDLWLGVCLGVAAATSASLGQTLQHLSKLRVEKFEVKPPPWCRPIWWAGQGLYTIANWFDVASLVFAPMSVIIVIYALRLPMVALMAAMVLHANVTRACALGISIIAAAAGISLAYAPKDRSSPFQRPSDFFTMPIVVYLVVSVLTWIVIGCDFWRHQRADALAPPSPRSRSSVGQVLRALRIPLLCAWVMTMGHMFNAGLGRLPLADGAKWYHLEWIWLPGIMSLLNFGGGLLNLVGVENQCTHIFVPTVFGFQAFLMGLQGSLFGEFRQLSALQRALWLLGMLGTMAGTVLVSSEDDSEKRAAVLSGKAHRHLSFEDEAEVPEQSAEEKGDETSPRIPASPGKESTSKHRIIGLPMQARMKGFSVVEPVASPTDIGS